MTINPQWETRRYFRHLETPFGGEFNPRHTAQEFLLLVRDGERASALAYILAENGNDFPWERLAHLRTIAYQEEGAFWFYCLFFDYIGHYQNHSDVFSVPVLYRMKAGVKEPSPTVGKQELYFVEKDREWKIIDVSPLERKTESVIITLLMATRLHREYAMISGSVI